MDSKKPLYKTKTFWVLFLFLLYSALGFFAVPYFMKKQLSEMTISELNSTLKIEKIDFNPFTIATDLRNIELIDQDKTLWLKAQNIHVNVNLWDTLFTHLSFDKLQLDNPHYYLMIDDKTATVIKYPQIKQQPIDPEENTEESEFNMDVSLIKINQGAINFNNNSSEKEINLNIREILFNHDSFTTLDNQNTFNLSFTTEKNEKATINGHFNLTQSSYDIAWSIDSFLTETLFHLIGDKNDTLSGFNNKTGKLFANGSLVSLEKTELPFLNINSLEIKEFSNGTQNASDLSAQLPLIQVMNTAIDLNNQAITIDTITANGIDLSASFDNDNHLILNRPITDSKNEQDQTAPWSYLVNEINLKESEININKIINESINSNLFAFETIQINNFTNSENEITDIKATALVDEEGSINMTSQVNLNTLDTTNNIQINSLNLNKWQSWVPPEIQLEISKGFLSLEQEIELKSNNILSNGWIKFNELELNDNNKQPFFSVNELHLNETTIDSKSKKISLSSIVIDKAQGELIVSENQQLNVSNITANNSETDENQVNSDDESWIIDIKEIELIDAQTSLTDKSIQPNYHTELSKINGNIKGLSSANLSKADINLTGLLDTYGKLNIEGQINPLSEKAYTDISINIENLDLQNFSSYSGQYLGFPINIGKVDFDLNYKLNESLLKGLNNLEFKQLKFGDKTASKDAINLPLKLAVGLLTDGNGIMTINLPVSGNIDDPEFSYGGIVFKAFFKLITGIVASPFKLLGKLVPGGADLDLSGIQFQAGGIELQDQEIVKLEAMKKILNQRPGILLELSGVVNTANDSKALKLKQLLTQLNLEEKPIFTEDYSIESIKAFYLQNFSEENWQQLLSDATQDEVVKIVMLAESVWKKLLESQNIDGQLNQLAKDRALYIQSQLIENYTVSEDKIFIKPNQLSDELYPQVKFGVGQ